MWKFTEIPPNETVVETCNEKKSNILFGPGLSNMSIKTEISTDIQKTRTDSFETNKKDENGKKVIETRHIITRVFTVRQEIKRGIQ